jgi:uncharacterized small protein (DUF1192 family)
VISSRHTLSVLTRDQLYNEIDWLRSEINRLTQELSRERAKPRPSDDYCCGSSCSSCDL